MADVRHDRRPPRPGESTSSVVLRVEDADAAFARAVAHGARVLSEPTDYEYGERQFSVTDPGSHQWIFSQTPADVAPEEWGGILVDDRR